FGPQLRIAFGAIAAAGPRRTPMALGTITAVRAVTAIGTILIRAMLVSASRLRTIRLGASRLRAIRVGAIRIGTPLPMPARLAVLPPVSRVRALSGARHGLAGRSRGRRP